MKYRIAPWIGGAFAVGLLTAQTLSAQVFWTANGGADIMRANLDGTGITSVFQRATSDSGLTGNIVDVAATSTHLYWTENVANGGGIWRSDHNGGGVEQIVSGSFSGGLQFLVADQRSDRIFFSDWNDGLYTANLAGGAATQITNPGGSTTTDAQSRNTGLALAGPNQLLSLAANTADRNVYSTDIAGNSFTALGEYGATTSHQSYGMAYDSSSNVVYVTTLNQGNLSAFDLNTNQSTQILPNGAVSRALGMDINPEQNLLYIVSQSHANNSGTPGIWTYDLDTEELNLWLATDASFGIAVIPEPGTYALFFGLAIGILLVIRRRIRS